MCVCAVCVCVCTCVCVCVCPGEDRITIELLKIGGDVTVSGCCHCSPLCGGLSKYQKIGGTRSPYLYIREGQQTCVTTLEEFLS